MSHGRGRQNLNGQPPHLAATAQPTLAFGGIVQRAPHPATVAQARSCGSVSKSPHAATVVQPRSPHPATVVQPKAARMGGRAGASARVVQRVAWPLTKLFGGVVQRSEEWPKERVQDEATRLLTEINSGVGGQLMGGEKTSNALRSISAQLMYIDRLVNQGVDVNKAKILNTAIDVCSSLMQDHIFTDGNKRTATNFFKRILAAAGVSLLIDDDSLSRALNQYDKPKQIKQILQKCLA